MRLGSGERDDERYLGCAAAAVEPERLVTFGEGVVVGDLLALLDVAQRHQLVVALRPMSRVSRHYTPTGNVERMEEEVRTMYQALPSQVWLT